MKYIGKPILAFVLFLIIQVVASFVIVAISAVLNQDFVTAISNNDRDAAIEASQNIVNNTAIVFSMALIFSSILSILAMIWPMRMFSPKRDFKPAGIGFAASAMAVVGTIFGIYATDIFSELLDLPNLIEVQMNGMMDSFWGVFVICVLGPIAEEVVFRAGALGYMLRKGANVWVAIFVSALLFGIMHFNPAQVPFAFAVGVMLGIVYYRTGNILLTSGIHILNNSLACLLTQCVGDDVKLTDEMGSMSGAFIAIVLSVFISYLLLNRFWKHTTDVAYVE